MASSIPGTLRELLDAVAARDELPAVLSLRTDGGVDAMSCGDLARCAYAASARLLQSGLRYGEPVVLLGPNGTEWIVGYFGILCAGGVPVPLDCQAGGGDLARIVAGCGARRAFTTAWQAEQLRTHGAPELAVTRFDELLPGGAEPSPATGGFPQLLPRLRPDDIAVQPYTSGTTGTPKGVPLTHRNLLSNLEALVAARLIGARDRVLLPLPLHHAYPFTCGLLGCLATGAPLVLPAGVTGPSLVAAIRGAGATVLLGVPRLYTALLAGIEARAGSGPVGQRLFRSALRLSAGLGRRAGLRPGGWLFRRVHREMGPTLRILVSGGARLEPDVAWRLEGLGWEVFSGYGLTETSPILTFNIRGRVRHDTVGRPLPGVQIRIDATAPGAQGEILARGPGVFAGYRGDPEATQRAFTPDGWFRTGDLGHVDADGYLHVAGRVKDVIALPGGKKMLPETVEAAYAASPLIREVALLVHEGRLVALVVPDEEGMRARGAARVSSLLREQLEGLSLGLPTYQRIA
ncbi:MAG: AMP-binding protein, partial [Gammaproteobacteria bacterium]|nr:AMP-binding protein [Gammaproteobacteria bacterium]